MSGKFQLGKWSLQKSIRAVKQVCRWSKERVLEDAGVLASPVFAFISHSGASTL